MSEVQSIPLYLQMAQQIAEQIERGELQAGARLPSYGQMRKEHGANPVTLERAYGVLEKRGLIRREAKRGVFVAEPKAVARPLLSVVTAPDLHDNEYYTHILNGIQKEAHRRRAELRLCQINSFADWTPADGIIVTFPSFQLQQSLPRNLPANVPSVATLLDGFYNIPSVTADDGAGIAASVQHLVALGHRRIGYLTLQKVPTLSAPGQHRLDAYRAAMLDAGIAVDPRWERALRDSEHEPLLGFVELGRLKMERWLRDDWFELGCTALLAQNDETAIGMMQALDDAGIRVPGQVSVMGFDGISAGRCVRPQLSTVVVPLEAIGEAAVAAVLDVGSPGIDSVNSRMLAPTFVERDSTAWAPDVSRSTLEPPHVWEAGKILELSKERLSCI